MKHQYGIFCPPHQISVGCFVHPGEVVWDLLSTLQKMAWELFSMGSFVRLPRGHFGNGACFCNKNILMHVLLCYSPFSSPTFLSFHSFSFLQPQHELVLPVTPVSNTYLQSTLRAYLTHESLSTGRLVRLLLSSISYQPHLQCSNTHCKDILSLQTLFTLHLIG